MTVKIFHPGPAHASAFLAAVRRSEALLAGWVSPPSTREQYVEYLRRYGSDAHCSYLARAGDGSLVGCINVNHMVHGALQSAYLGYYAFSPNQGRGLMKAALGAVISRAFETHRLHRLEANIQPANARSVGLVTALGFRLEGYSPRYLYIDGQWRDHERYAITAEEWSAPGASTPAV
ncbi:GNAT family N-acetyltransferase [Larsenimonas rhizosphaerae]|uniref:GNAT family N-acetyltransferase n=1 Tax=Larsenimonas rhizosphaerae TaxID=2944682 RepID=UPI002033A137|nr:GNAT family protein [Larsenimonas rhizosphaerae]MCM2129783.1 GNAT family N-acetyltransferase [Larsenimonas rhizosphaerae]